MDNVNEKETLFFIYAIQEISRVSGPRNGYVIIIQGTF